MFRFGNCFHENHPHETAVAQKLSLIFRNLKIYFYCFQVIYNEENEGVPTVYEPRRKKPREDPKLQSSCSSSNTESNESDIEIELHRFFDYLMEKIKFYHADTRNTVQHKIYQIIVNADKGLYDNAVGSIYEPLGDL